MGETLTILVVDDEEVIRQSFSDELEDMGYNVYTAHDGTAAVEILGQKKPDLIMTDLRMPELSGIDVIRRAKILVPDTPVIVISGAGQIDDAVESLRQGAYDYLTKPVKDMGVLHHSVERALEKARLIRENKAYQQHLEEQVRERTRELRETQLKIVQRLGRAGEYRDNETGAHVIRMSRSCQMLALAAGLEETHAEQILHASPMHDIGKIGIPDEILLKPGRLDDQEMEIMKRHAEFGADIIGDDRSELLKMARMIALTHHEKWDGSGYPKGLSGLEIPVEGRITAICDVFDALTSERPYKNAWPVEKATEFLKGQSGSHFDPELLEKFLTIIPDVVALRELHPDEEE